MAEVTEDKGGPRHNAVFFLLCFADRASQYYFYLSNQPTWCTKFVLQ